MYGLLINGGVYDFMNFTAERFENTSYGEKGNQCIARYFDIHFLSRNRSIHVVRIVNYKNGLHTYVWGGGRGGGGGGGGGGGLHKNLQGKAHFRYVHKKVVPIRWIT